MAHETLKYNDIPIKNEENYFDYLHKPYLVNSFESIGWPDPLPHPMRQKDKP